MAQPTCNVCGSKNFVDMNARPKARCAACSSLERTRALQMVIFRRQLVKPGGRVLHIAPELGLSRNIRSIPKVDYDPRDINPGGFAKELKVKRIDLVADAETLPSAHYDLVLHSHVMEHIPSNVTAVLFHLHRALKPTGAHVFCLPIFRGHYEEDIGPRTPEERITRFHQNDHVRRFGREDLHLTLGKVFSLPRDYNLSLEFPPAELLAANIPEACWRGFTSNTVFCMRKGDLLLQM